jgi:hypothetical protein
MIRPPSWPCCWRATIVGQAAERGTDPLDSPRWSDMRKEMFGLRQGGVR